MVRIKPFEAIRPPANLAPRVSSVPYDVVNTDEARVLAQGNPDSFLHVLRPEIDLPDGTDPYADEVYAAAATAMQSLMESGSLVRDAQPGIYLYRQVFNGRAQVGVVCCCHIDDYREDRIRKHERTRPDKEDDRTRHVLTLDAHAGPIFLTHRNNVRLDAAVAKDTGHRPLQHFIAADGVTHTIWKATDPTEYVEHFAGMDIVYVADGHHRSASAARAAAQRAEMNPDHSGDEEYNWFLAVLFPADQLTILPYNRLVMDLGGHDEPGFLDALAAVGTLAESDGTEPDRPGVISIFVGHRWWSLALDPSTIDAGDPIASLDVSLLHDRILSPLLGIEDQRTDPRIGFVGGIRGAAELERHVATGDAAAAFMLHATSIDQLMAVSDAGLCMPPKSTWFEPKLRSGLFVHALDWATADVG